MVEAHDQLAIRRPHVEEPQPKDHTVLERRRRRLPLVASLLVALMFAAGFAVVLLVDNEMSGSSHDAAPPTTGETASEVTATTTSGSSSTGGRVDSLPSVPNADDLPEGDDEDRMSIQIETAGDLPAGPDGVGGATASIKTDGRLYFEGAFRSAEEAERHVTRAAEVFGTDAIVEDYVIDPEAPAPTAGDVALDKPVLFEPGSATIHPEYIPFLEACGNVLKLNPQITMSISAFTDSVGPEAFNLELSRRRAQAVVDFYRDLDVADEQLVGHGFGEEAQFGDNETEAGRSENRRAMLQLLNVMSDS